jgi:hypothetical protein
LSRGRLVKASILLALALATSTAQAAERAVVLACEGKVTQPPGPKPEPVSVGIIINFTAGTVNRRLPRFQQQPDPYRQHKPQDRRHGRDFHANGGLKNAPHQSNESLLAEMQARVVDVLRRRNARPGHPWITLQS